MAGESSRCSGCASGGVSGAVSRACRINHSVVDVAGDDGRSGVALRMRAAGPRGPRTETSSVAQLEEERTFLSLAAAVPLSRKSCSVREGEGSID